MVLLVALTGDLRRSFYGDSVMPRYFVAIGRLLVIHRWCFVAVCADVMICVDGR